MGLSIAFFDGRFQTPLTFLFALLGGFLISYASRRIRYVEAFIGLLYALGISAIMIVLAQSSEGVELFKKMSAADILFSSSSDVVQSLLLYGIIATVMFWLYPRLQGVAKELLFFASLSLTVTFSVQSAGVLVVFSLLIAPAYIALLQKRWPPLPFAWFVGSLGVCGALAISYGFDLPTGYTIVALEALLALFGAFFLGAKNEKFS